MDRVTLQSTLWYIVNPGLSFISDVCGEWRFKVKFPATRCTSYTEMQVYKGDKDQCLSHPQDCFTDEGTASKERRTLF